MKSVFIRVYPWLIITGQLMAADPVSDALQKGLFEEEANHNLEAAIKAYQSVIDQTAEQRKLTATAVFRLGECYRKLNKTNDAVLQYQRLVRDFSDQTNLFALSKQNLAGLGAASQPQSPAFADRLRSLVDAPAPRPQPQPVDLQAAEIARLKALVKDSPDLLSAKNEKGNTPLHHAAEENYLQVAEFLLASKVDVNGPNARRNTPLHTAVCWGYKGMVELLLTNGADLSARGSCGDRTYGSNSEDVIIPYDCQPLHMAVFKGHQSMVELLLDYKADVNGAAHHGRTPMHFAVDQGFLGIARLLLSKGADVNLADWRGRTPAMVAAAAGHDNIFRALLDAGADINAQNKDGDTLAHYAARQRSPAMLKTVLERKPDLEIENRNGETPLMTAMLSHNLQTMQLLLQAGANVNARNEKGYFPLYLALAYKVDKAILRSLLACKPNLNQTNLQGHTTLSIAIDMSLNKGVSAPDRKAAAEMVDLLRQHGAKEKTARVPLIGLKHNDTMVNEQYLRQDANAWNQFTIFELILFIYSGHGSTEDRRATHTTSMYFPDFSKIRIQRLIGPGDERKTIELNLGEALASGDCSQNIPLAWGDIVELASQDHKVNESWRGVAPEVAQTVAKCLERHVTIIVKGETKRVRLRPEIARYQRGKLQPEVPVGPDGVLRSLRLQNVLADSGVLRTSSDRTRVKVIRTLPKTQEKREIVLNVEAISLNDDLVLRDGDLIQVPEKP